MKAISTTEAAPKEKHVRSKSCCTMLCVLPCDVCYLVLYRCIDFYLEGEGLLLSLEGVAQVSIIQFTCCVLEGMLCNTSHLQRWFQKCGQEHGQRDAILV